MKNKSKLTKEEQQKAAREYLFTSLLTFGFDLSILQRFFRHVYDRSEEHEKIFVDTIQGGYRHRYYSDDCPRMEITPVGEVGGYYIVRTADLVRPVKPRKTSGDYFEREYANALTTLMDVTLHRATWDDSLDHLRRLPQSGKLGSIRNKKLRTLIRLYTAQILLCSTQDHIDRFKSVVVSYWRKALETLRVELHLSGKHTYNEEIRHVDSFLKILENSK